MTTTVVAELIREHVQVRRDLPEPRERRRLRTSAGLSQAKMARIVGASASAIGHWELGIRTPQGDLLDRYVEALRALRDAL